MNVLKTWLKVGFYACRRNFILSLVIIALFAVNNYITLKLNANLIDNFSSGETSTAWANLVGLVGIILFSLSVSILNERNSTQMDMKLKYTYSKEMIGVLNKVDILDFQKKEFYDLFQYTSGAMSNPRVISSTLFSFQMLFAAISYAAVVISSLSSQNLIIILLILAAILFIAAVIGHKKSKRFFSLQDKIVPIDIAKGNFSNILLGNNFFQENLIFNFSGYILKKWKAKYEQKLNCTMQENKRRIQDDIIFNFVIIVLSGLVILSIYFLNDVNSVGSFIVTLGAVTSLMFIVQDSSSHIEYFMQYRGTLKKFSEISQYFVAPNEESQSVGAAKSENDDIILSELHFTYPNNAEPTLTGINGRIKKNKVTAIVGQNGCGKTTLIKLLSGLYKPTKGHVFIDNVDSWEELNINEKGNICVVPQNFGRYDAISLRENITFGKKDIEINFDFKEYEKIFEAKLDDIVGNDFGGTNFSTGQWQYIAIIRALIHKSDIVILDEPTSALDPIAERKIYNWFLERTKDKTVIIVTHRLGAVRNADEIIVMEQGNIKEIGTHENLMALEGGLYNEMFTSQASWYKGSVK